MILLLITLFWPQGSVGLRSLLTRDQTHIPCVEGKVNPQWVELPGSPTSYSFNWTDLCTKIGMPGVFSFMLFSMLHSLQYFIRENNNIILSSPFKCFPWNTSLWLLISGSTWSSPRTWKTSLFCRISIWEWWAQHHLYVRFLLFFKHFPICN